MYKIYIWIYKDSNPTLRKMLSTKNILINDKSTRKAQHQIFKLIIVLILTQSVLNAGADNSESFNEASNMLVVKNNKIVSIRVDNLIDENKEISNPRVWITNTQEAFKI